MHFLVSRIRLHLPPQDGDEEDPKSFEPNWGDFHPGRSAQAPRSQSVTYTGGCRHAFPITVHLSTRAIRSLAISLGGFHEAPDNIYSCLIIRFVKMCSDPRQIGIDGESKAAPVHGSHQQLQAKLIRAVQLE